ncbi:hypothetical protein AAZX31_09G122100 [Glycine max]
MIALPFFRFSSLIYAMIYHSWTLIRSFNSLKVKGEVQMKKGLWWITRYPETRKGIVSDEMLRGVENKHRYEDS